MPRLAAAALTAVASFAVSDAVVPTAAVPVFNTPIEHVVILMEEVRCAAPLCRVCRRAPCELNAQHGRGGGGHDVMRCRKPCPLPTLPSVAFRHTERGPRGLSCLCIRACLYYTLCNPSIRIGRSTTCSGICLA